MIFLPKQARMVFLSATLPNSLEFARWVATLHSQPCHVVYTDYRPTPLVHYGYPMKGKGLYLVRVWACGWLHIECGHEGGGSQWELVHFRKRL
jgi:hypothetical protein